MARNLRRWSVFFQGKYHYFRYVVDARAFGLENGLKGVFIYAEHIGEDVEEEEE